MKFLEQVFQVQRQEPNRLEDYSRRTKILVFFQLTIKIMHSPKVKAIETAKGSDILFFRSIRK